MCGIAGCAGAPALDPCVRARLTAMLDAIVHRGPDDSGTYFGPGVALGMRRLSIIDLAGGHQPIANEDGSITVVFNGEIYNHRQLRQELIQRGHAFRTRSDTEVLVHLYEEVGDRLVDRLRGMFALAIWDARRESLLLARDRFGIKPLSYALGDAGIAFFSECGSFVAAAERPPELDPLSIARYLAFGYVPDPWSVYAGVRKLPPGHLLRWNADGTSELKRYWAPLSHRARLGTETDVKRELVRLLDEAVACHLEADVPLGAFLSGGVDSSTVVALMARHSAGRVKTFSIGFSEQAYNEAPAAARVAKALGTEHTELVVRPDAESLFEQIVGIYDEPFADSSAIPTFLVSQLARRHVKVALSGDGGDELFGGYTRYAEIGARPQWPRPVRRALRSLALLLPHGALGRNRIYDLGRTQRGQYANTVLAPLLLSEGGVGAEALGAQLGEVEQILAPWFEGMDGEPLLASLMLVDQSTYLPGDILTKVDRASMAVSLEARVPLLDHELADFANGISADLKIQGGRGKLLFKQAIEGIVPPEVLTKPKQGFAIPLAEWFRGPLRPRLEAIRRADAEITPYVHRPAVERLLAEHQRGRRDHSAMLWRLLALELWLQRS
ncbi:MAG TPA: asparagine synthase (glutamine-hydrolyzing), partial [Gemmatimonadales bacterium]